MDAAPIWPGGLSGLRVLDLAGPGFEYCGRLLADLGAEVIRIEPPGGRPSRAERAVPTFRHHNANKSRVRLDPATSAGREAFLRLISRPETQARIRHTLSTGKPLRN